MGFLDRVASVLSGLAVLVLGAGTPRVEASILPWSIAQEGMPDIRDSAYGAGLYVVVGDSGHIWTSPDGSSWTHRANPDPALRNLRGVTVGGGQFVAVGFPSPSPPFGQAVLTSPDGIVWAYHDAAAAGHLDMFGVTYGNGLYVAVGGYGTLITSTDGASWVARTSSTTASLYGVAYASGLYVAVGDSAVVTSPDGVTWTLQPGSPAANMRGLIHDGTRFIAASSQGMLTSVDGAVWSLTQAASGTDVYGSGSLRVAVLGPFVSTSVDGLNWNTALLPLPAPGESRYAYTVVHGPQGFLVAGYGGVLYLSPSGLGSWQDRTLDASRSLHGVAHDGVRYCAVGEFGAAATSSDGIAWTNGPGVAQYEDAWADIVSAPGGFVAVGNGFPGARAMTSPDCVSWTAHDVPAPDDGIVEKVAYGNGRLVVVGAKTTGGPFRPLAMLSTDGGTSWQEVDPALPTTEDGELTGVTFGAGLFVACGANFASGEVYVTTSPDGVIWTRQTSPDLLNGGFPINLTFGEGLFVIVGDFVLTSPDGSVWTMQTSAFDVYGVAHGSESFAGVGRGGHGYTSEDGMAWTSTNAVTGVTLGEATFAPALGRFVATGTSVIQYADENLRTVSVGDVSVVEGDAGTTSAAFVVTLSAASPVPVTVTFATADGTAHGGSDYAPTSGTVTLLPGTTAATASVAVIGDTLAEPDETFLLNLTGASGAAVADAQGLATIQNDDPPAASVADVVVSEGTGGTTNAVFEVTLSQAPVQAASMTYATSDGSATAGSDYVATAGVLSFAPGQTQATVTVGVTPDALIETDELFAVDLTAPAGATLGDGHAVGTISDDDAPSLSHNELVQGSTQAHDLAAQPGPVPDRDYFRLGQRPRSSYEVVIDALSADLVPLVAERLAADNSTVMQTGVSVSGGSSVSLRWRNDSPALVVNQTISVRSGGCSVDCDSADTYRISLRETTAYVARFNNAGGQVTVLTLQNLGGEPLAGMAWFRKVDGLDAGSEAFNIGPRGSLALNTSTLPGLSGLSGSITLSHDGRHGALAGKATAVEPATGFTFDTPLVSRP